MVVYSQLRKTEKVFVNGQPIEYAIAVWKYEDGKQKGKYQTGLYHHGKFFADRQDTLKTLDGAIRRLHKLHERNY